MTSWALPGLLLVALAAPASAERWCAEAGGARGCFPSRDDCYSRLRACRARNQAARRHRAAGGSTRDIACPSRCCREGGAASECVAAADGAAASLSEFDAMIQAAAARSGTGDARELGVFQELNLKLQQDVQALQAKAAAAPSPAFKGAQAKIADLDTCMAKAKTEAEERACLPPDAVEESGVIDPLALKDSQLKDQRLSADVPRIARGALLLNRHCESAQTSAFGDELKKRFCGSYLDSIDPGQEGFIQLSGSDLVKVWAKGEAGVKGKIPGFLEAKTGLCIEKVVSSCSEIKTNWGYAAAHKLELLPPDGRARRASLEENVTFADTDVLELTVDRGPGLKSVRDDDGTGVQFESASGDAASVKVKATQVSVEGEKAVAGEFVKGYGKADIKVRGELPAEIKRQASEAAGKAAGWGREAWETGGSWWRVHRDAGRR